MNLLFVVGCLWFFLPAGFANMAPVIAAKLLGKGSPIDGGRSLNGTRIFGQNKTWQGLVAGVIASTAFFLLQIWLYKFHAIQRISIIDYAKVSILLGTFMGIGALLGDVTKSFFKRRAKVKPGSSWFPFDQIDYIIGGLLLSLPFVALNWNALIAIFLCYFLLHLLVNWIGYLIRLRPTKI